MEGDSGAGFWYAALEIVFLLGVLPSLVIAGVNRYTTRDFYGLYRVVWMLVTLGLFILVWRHFAAPFSSLMP